MNRLEIAQYIAAGATALSVIGFLLSSPLPGLAGVLVLLGLAGGIVSYVFGGLWTALCMAGKIAKWGWLIVPFPLDIVTGICAFLYAIFAMLFLPIIPVRKAYKEQMLK